MDMHPLEYLKPFCKTDRQTEVLEAIISCGNNRPAAIKLKCHHSVVDKTLTRLKRYAALQGASPEHDMVHTVPDGFKVKGVSTYYNKDGKPTGQWVKSNADDKRRYQIMLEALAALKEELPRYNPILRLLTASTNADLISVYVITDFHLNMRSWHQETGADWDMDIAENLLTDWFQQAIRLSPASDHAVFAQLGDFMHSDGWAALTPASGHLLDVDTRFQKAIRVAIRVIRRIITSLLEKHNRVTILMADGNHDPASSAWLREWLAAVYDNEPRITVDTSADTYYCIEHGETSLFFHHGHRRTTSNVDDVFVAKFRQVFGRTKFSYAHIGHLHSNELKETNLMQVERHRTLAAPDAYAAKGGWVSGRDAKVIVYHRNYGEVSRLTISPDFVQGHK